MRYELSTLYMFLFHMPAKHPAGLPLIHVLHVDVLFPLSDSSLVVNLASIMMVYAVSRASDFSRTC